MSEIDYQMALLLQHRFEQEHKSERVFHNSDTELARQLQEQFEQEAAIEQPSSDLVLKPRRTSHNSSKSLIDPSWELVDPTPDIHTLFVVFNERFFWNKLLTVCVSWSKRMTSCAGICSYNGRGGMCSITLSEPLLKLRPRKDLVETLLHEMIHAYLFVTHNNKDRDGHGPEFHKHMYRINKESGTSITVYHSFHDEVRLYQQHWWRCNGPCQRWKPYFGMVRRATNRAPGPNDRWWAEHSRNCGGTFIKVKEPEKPQKQQKPETNKNISNTKSKDIRDFFVSNGKDSTASNVKGFKDLTSKVKGRYNSSSTITVTKNSNHEDGSAFKPIAINATSQNTKQTTAKTDPTGSVSTDYSNDFLTVRSHWANKFSDKKRPGPEVPSTSSKIQRVNTDEYCECPVCNKRLLLTELNSHLDSCLNEPKNEEKKECWVCGAKVEVLAFNLHLGNCLKKVHGEIEDEFNTEPWPEKVQCLACGQNILKNDLETHLEDCMGNIFDADATLKDSTDKQDDKQRSSHLFNCPFCMLLVEEIDMKEHLDACLKSDKIDLVEFLGDDSF